MSSSAAHLLTEGNCHQEDQIEEREELSPWCVQMREDHPETRKRLLETKQGSTPHPDDMDSSCRVEELLRQLEEERQSVRREKLSVACLQREVERSKGTMREKLIQELEEERRLRLESEKRLREVSEESAEGRAHMVSLQQQFSRMEETVRSLLLNQGVLEQTAVDTVDIMKAYKDKLSEEVRKQQQEVTEAGVEKDGEKDGEKDETKILLERLKALEERNSVLSLENESQRQQYERCLDEVANQVVQALLTQKDLREECVKLRSRVFDLEQQNRALGVLFQQRIKPASDLLLQKLHSRILDLSAADLLMESELKNTSLLQQGAPPSNEAQLSGKLAFPLSKCLSQLSLTAPLTAQLTAQLSAPLTYPRSSRSSSELSLSSACSDFSSGSYTWNDGRSGGQKSSLTWEKRLSLGSSAPSNICGAADDPPPPTRRKESNILEGLRRLQRKRHRSSSCSARVSPYKDCMNSNEGIYSLGIKAGVAGKVGVTKLAANRTRGKRFSYDSDDADDELVHSTRVGDDIPTRDGWFQTQSNSVSDSSWERTVEEISSPGPTKPPPGYDSKERPEKLLSFINSFLPEGRPSAFRRPSKLHRNLPDAQDPVHDLDNLRPEPGAIRTSAFRRLPEPEHDSRRMSRDTAKLLSQQGRTQSADSRPRPISLIQEPPRCTQSQESVHAIFDADGKPIEVCPLKGSGDYAELERPTRQKAASRNYSVLESPEKPSELLLLHKDSAADHLSTPTTPQKKLIKPPISRASKGFSIPPMNEAVKSSGSKLPSRNKPSGSPLRVSKGCSTEPSSGIGPSGVDKSPLSPATKTSRFIKTSTTSSQSPKSGKVSGRAEWSKAPASPRLSRKLRDYSDSAEPPTRDKHSEMGKTQLKSPSPPPPPGRSTSLLVRPHYEGGVVPTSTAVRGPPPSYHTSLLPNTQGTLPIKDKDCADWDAGYGTAPQKQVERTVLHYQKSPSANTPTKSTPTKTTNKTTKDYLPPPTAGCPHEPEPRSSKNNPPPYGALRGSSSFISKRGSTHENQHQSVQKTSVSLPLQETSQNCKAAETPPTFGVISPNSGEKSPKTRIPMGFKAFLKSPPSHKTGQSVAGKQEKDHINSVSKETVTSFASAQPGFNIDRPPPTCPQEGKSDVITSPLASEDPRTPEEAKRSSQLFGRSISVTTKPHLKPALGMNGAKARSQSFSTNYLEKPSSTAASTAVDTPGKVRTGIITNSGERGNSLTRQSSLEVPSESPAHSPRTRLSHYGGMTAAVCGHAAAVIPERTSRLGSKGEGPHGNSQKDLRVSLNSQAVSHSQFPSSCLAGSQDLASPPADVSKQETPIKPLEEKKSSSIEEKVMMGIERKCQEQEKAAKAAASNSEVKQKSGSSLANWFGLRRTKLPALSSSGGIGKKNESKEEKKELKMQAGKQRKEKKKNDGLAISANLSEVNEKMNAINKQAMPIQSSAPFSGKKDQLVKDLLGKTEGKSALSPPGIAASRKEMKMEVEICHDTATLLISQKMNFQDGHLPESSCQDHHIHGCQMRTLDSGIGTFPLPDSTSRATGRHLAKSQSDPPSSFDPSPSGSTPSPSGSSPSHPHLRLAPTPQRLPSLGHSLSDPSMTCKQEVLPQLSPSDAIRTKRSSLFVARTSFFSSTPMEEREREPERRRNLKEDEKGKEAPASPCMWSSSEMEVKPEGSSRRHEEEQEEAPRRRRRSSLSLLDLYKDQDFCSQLDSSSSFPGGGATDALTKELPVTPPTPPADLPSTSSSSFASRDAPNTGGSLSDSLYDSFSSCTSHASAGHV